MPSRGDQLNELAALLSGVAIDTTSESRSTWPKKVFPPGCNLNLISCGIDGMTRLMQPLVNIVGTSTGQLTRPEITLQDHAIYALIYYSLDKLHCDGYHTPSTLGAIALQHSGSDHRIVLETWEYALVKGTLKGKLKAIIREDAEIGELRIGLGELEVRGEHDADFQRLLHTPIGQMPFEMIQAGILETAIAATYERLSNMLAANNDILGAEPAAVVAIGACRQLQRMGYDLDLMFKALAVTDLHFLLVDAGGSPELAWWSALFEYPEDMHKDVKDAWGVAKMSSEMEGLVDDFEMML